MVNDLHVDFSHFQWQNLPIFSSQAITFGTTITVGAPYNYPQIFYQNVQEYRDDLFHLAGNPSLKFGGEVLHSANTGLFQQNQAGTASACASIAAKTVNGVSYSAAQVAADLFPKGTSNVASWNYTSTANPTQSSINSLCALGTFTQGSGNFNVNIPRTQIAFSDIAANQTIDGQIFNGVPSLQNSVTGPSTSNLNLLNPFPPSITAPRQAVQPLGPNVSTPYALQMSAGIQRELPLRTVVTADYVHTRLYHDWIRLNSNLIQNPANPEFNYSPSTRHAAGHGTTCPPEAVTQDTTPYTTSSFNVCAQAFTNVNQFFTPNDAGSIYDALHMRLRHSLQHGFTAALPSPYSPLT